MGSSGITTLAARLVSRVEEQSEGQLETEAEAMDTDSRILVSEGNNVLEEPGRPVYGELETRR